MTVALLVVLTFCLLWKEDLLRRRFLCWCRKSSHSFRANSSRLGFRSLSPKVNHLQANPASEDYLVPTRLEPKTSAGLTAGKITYPPGKPYRLSGADKDLKTYEGNFEIGVLLKASSQARPGKYILQGRLHYQACDSRTCLFPTSVPLMLTVNVVATHQKSPQARGAKP